MCAAVGHPPSVTAKVAPMMAALRQRDPPSYWWYIWQVRFLAGPISADLARSDKCRDHATPARASCKGALGPRCAPPVLQAFTGVEVQPSAEAAQAACRASLRASVAALRGTGVRVQARARSRSRMRTGGRPDFGTRSLAVAGGAGGRGPDRRRERAVDHHGGAGRQRGVLRARAARVWAQRPPERPRAKVSAEGGRAGGTICR